MKQIMPRQEMIDLPHIRIAVTELLEILERVSDGKFEVIGKTSDVMFENIEDMNSHLAECARVSYIEIGPVVLHIHGDWMSPVLTIDLYELHRPEIGCTIDEARMLMKSMEQELTPYKSWLATSFVRGLFAVTMTIGITLAVLYVRNYLLGPDLVQSTQLSSVIIRLIFFIFWSALLGWIGITVLEKAIGENTVFHQPRESWWQRHSSQIFVGAFTAVFGAAATFFLTK